MIDLNNPRVFDLWREQYDTMTDQEHKEFMEAAAVRWPDQQHHTLANFDALFTHADPGSSVVEIGGWTGDLAKHCLSKYKIEAWINIEPCAQAVARTTRMTDLPYFALVPQKMRWFENSELIRRMVPDILIAAHMIEHLSDNDLIRLVGAISGVPEVMFEAPIGDTESDWRGYYGTHILKMGWSGVSELMKSRGYHIHRVNPTCYLYTL